MRTEHSVQRFEDLKEPDLLALTNDQIVRWIDIECACNGVPLLPPKPVEPTKVAFTPNIQAFEVADLIFDSSADALRLVALLRELKVYRSEYVSGPHYERVLKLGREFSIESKRYFTPEAWDAVKDEAAAYTRDFNIYTAAKKEYDAIVQVRARIVNGINEAIENAHQRENIRQRVRADFDRYLDLADGNRKIALAFLRAAWTHDPARVDEVFPPLSPELQEIADNPDPRD
jgi:hypothetical protein